MKIATLINSAILLSSMALIPGIAAAQTPNNSNASIPGIAAVQTVTNSNIALRPFNTVFLAYQGYLQDQGIPSASALLLEYQTGNLTAKDLVQAAVKANRLPAKVLNDQSYLSAVDSQLTDLSRDTFDLQD